MEYYDIDPIKDLSPSVIREILEEVAYKIKDDVDLTDLFDNIPKIHINNIRAKDIGKLVKFDAKVNWQKGNEVTLTQRFRYGTKGFRRSTQKSIRGIHPTRTYLTYKIGEKYEAIGILIRTKRFKIGFYLELFGLAPKKKLEATRKMQGQL